MLLLYIVLACVALRALLARYSPQIDAVILHMTAVWYDSPAPPTPRGSLLDVGIGTALGAARRCPRRSSIRTTCRSVGIDYARAGVPAKPRAPPCGPRPLTRVAWVLACRFTANPRGWPADDRRARPVRRGLLLGLAHAHAQSGRRHRRGRPHGQAGRPPIYVGQTYQRRALPLLAWVKPLLKYATTIDFGQLTYEHDVRRIYDEAATVAGVRVTSTPRSRARSTRNAQVARLSILEGRAPVTRNYPATEEAQGAAAGDAGDDAVASRCMSTRECRLKLLEHQPQGEKPSACARVHSRGMAELVAKPRAAPQQQRCARRV